MVITCHREGIEQARPKECACKKGRFNRHGWYFRQIAGEQTYGFVCGNCKKHITLIPSTCVPYKHYPVSTIEPALDSRLTQGKSGMELEREHGVHRSTIYGWFKEFRGHLMVLATEGAQRLGIKPLSASPEQIYQGLKEHYQYSQSFFSDFQVTLCRVFPPLGLFRPLDFSLG